MAAYIDIIVLLIVVFLVFHKLRNVLGSRPDIRITKETKISEEDAAKLFELIVKETEKQTKPTVIGASTLTGDDAVLAQIPNFNKDNFLSGAKKAFEIIITNFAKGETKSFESFVAKPLVKKFQEIIESRNKDKISAETELVGFEAAEITEAKISKTNIVKVAVKFVSEQINILKNAKGEVVEGDENFIQKITDIWTFERGLDSNNPNWLLVSTKKK